MFIAKPRWTRLAYRLLKKPANVPYAIMAVQLRERTQRTGEHSNNDIYFQKHVCNHAGIKQDKRTTTVLWLFTHSHLTFHYFKDTAPRHSYKEKPQERQGQNWTSWVFKSLRSCGDRKSSEGPCWLPVTLVVTRWALVRRPSVALPALRGTPPAPDFTLDSTGSSVDQRGRERARRKTL